MSSVVLESTAVPKVHFSLEIDIYQYQLQQDVRSGFSMIIVMVLAFSAVLCVL